MRDGLYILSMMVSVPFIFLLGNLLVDQLHNLFTNTTSYERARKKNSKKKKDELILSDVDINSSSINSNSSILAVSDE